MHIIVDLGGCNDEEKALHGQLDFSRSSVLIIAISPFVGYHFTSEYLPVVEWLPDILVVPGSFLGGAAAFLIALAIFGRFLPEDMLKGPTTR